MANLVVWEGLNEYYAELKALPDACAGEALKLVSGTVNGVYVAIKGAYPHRTGNLRNGMKIKNAVVKGLVVGAEVRNSAKLATIFEKGSRARHYYTVNGVKKLTGAMPAGHVFVPRVVAARRRLTQELKDMVARHGAVVTGE